MPSSSAPEVDERMYGADVRWGYAIPWVFRSLSSPRVLAPMPAVPSRDTTFEHVLGYWGALLHLLVWGFGCPDRGLRWWYDAGFPTDDRRLALIDEVWRADGQLDWFAAWLWTNEPHTYLQPSLDGARSNRTERGSEWLRRVEAEVELAGIPNPYSGGTNPLHLDVYGLPDGDVSSHSVLHAAVNAETGRVQLVLDSMYGWYETIDHVGSAHPGLAVDVVAAPVGFLGTYRRSNRTGLWYNGSHKLHLVGN